MSAPQDALFVKFYSLQQEPDLFHHLVERALGDSLGGLRALCGALREISLVVYNAVEVLAHGSQLLYDGLADLGFEVALAAAEK